MRLNKNTAFAAILALAVPSVAAAYSYNVKSPFTGTVTATTNYSSGAFHGAVDISSGTCNYWGVETGVVASLAWTVTIRTNGVHCDGTGSGTQNEAKHSFGNGKTFRLWHFIKTSDSVNRTCNRCQVGNEGGTGNATGAHVHLQYDQNGSNLTGWYSGYVSRGQSVNRTTTIGVLQ
jgi:hypothetical protein